MRLNNWFFYCFFLLPNQKVYFIKYKSQKEQVSTVTEPSPLAYLPAAEDVNEHTHFDQSYQSRTAPVQQHSVHHDAAVSTTATDAIHGSPSTSHVSDARHSTLHSGASNQYIPPVSH